MARAEGDWPPRHGWSPLVTELHVHDIAASLSVWCDLLGFGIAYQRAEEKFAYLQRDEGGQIMLCQRNGRFETGPMRPPLGQGAMFQVAVDALDPVLSRLSVAGWPLYQPAREAWRRAGGVETGHREAFVQDPDGYLLMLWRHIGQRPIEGAG